MGGSVGMIGNAVRAGGGFGGKSSGMGQSNYGNAQGFTPIGQTPAAPQAPEPQAQSTQQAPMYMPGSAFGGGFGLPMMGGFGGGFGGKSSGLGQFGMMNSPFGGFNPYAQQPMDGMRPFNPNASTGGQLVKPPPFGMPGNSGFPDPRMQQDIPQQQMGGLADAMQQIQAARVSRSQQAPTPIQSPGFDYSNIRPDMLIDPTRAGWSQFQQPSGFSRRRAAPIPEGAYTDANGVVWVRKAGGGFIKLEDSEE